MSYKLLLFENVRPRQKQRPRFSHRGGKTRTYTPKQTKDFEAKLKSLAMQDLPENWKPLKGDVKLTIRLKFEVPVSWSKEKKEKALNGEIKPNKKNGDIDNLAKSVLDSLNGVIYEDDHQVNELEISKFYSETNEIAVHIFYEDEEDEEDEESEGLSPDELYNGMRKSIFR